MLYLDSAVCSIIWDISGAHEAVPRIISDGGTVIMQKSGKRIIRSVIVALVLLTVLCAFASADTLKPGSKGSAVYQLQVELKEKGYYTRSVTSKYTYTVKKAVSVFQIANDIKPEVRLGYADDTTQEKVFSEDAVLYSEYVEKLADTQCQLGGKGTYVKKVQKRLRSLGYYSSKLDGKYNSSTQVAVKLFQTANSLSVTGVADSATRTVLNSDNAVTRAKYDEANYLAPLKYGSKGTQVTQLQKKLADQGYYWSDTTGVFDTQTKYSVKFFQEANGLKVNGSVTRSLRELANSGDAVSFETYTKGMQLVQLSSSAKKGVKVAVLQLRLKELGYYTSVITGVYTGQVTSAVRKFQIYNNMASKYVTGKANTATRTLMNSNDALSYSEVNGSDTLKTGSSGTAVKTLQTRLKELGYYTGSVDGVYDSAVASAVKRFQKLNGLYQTGIAYTTTLTVLYSNSAVSYVNANIEKLIAVAKSRLGDPYVSNKRGPHAFDCSGFTYYCLRRLGISVSGEVSAQGRTTKGKRITKISDLKRGDLLYFDTQTGKSPGHAAIYLGVVRGKKRFIHATSSPKYLCVTETEFKEWYKERFMWGVRIWE